MDPHIHRKSADLTGVEGYIYSSLADIDKSVDRTIFLHLTITMSGASDNRLKCYLDFESKQNAEKLQEWISSNLPIKIEEDLGGIEFIFTDKRTISYPYIPTVVIVPNAEQAIGVQSSRGVLVVVDDLSRVSDDRSPFTGAQVRKETKEWANRYVHGEKEPLDPVPFVKHLVKTLYVHRRDIMMLRDQMLRLNQQLVNKGLNSVDALIEAEIEPYSLRRMPGAASVADLKDEITAMRARAKKLHLFV